MAKATVRGITIELGGDTTKLGKALDDVKKRGSALSNELRDVEKLLKFNPGNSDLLAQKQQILSEAVANTAKRLETLKQVYAEAEQQAAKGELGADQLRVLEREIVSTTQWLEKYEQSAKETESALSVLGQGSENASDGVEEVSDDAKKAANSLDEYSSAADKADSASSGLGSALSKLADFSIVADGVKNITDSLGEAADASREYRKETGKLESAFVSANHSSETATATYKTLQGVIGETDQSVEAAQQIALLANSEENAAKWAEQAAGVVGKFGDALQPETFFESANETIKLGEATGAYTQMLEGCGMSVEEFNKGLSKCKTEAEKQAYMLSVTEQALGSAGDAYREINADIIASNEANEAWNSSVADIGGSVDPIISSLKTMGATMIGELVPGVQTLASSFSGLLSGDAGAAAGVGEALSGIIDQLLTTIYGLAPTVATAGISLITSLTTTLISSLPTILATGVQVIMALINGLTQAIPQVTQAIVTVIPQLVAALVSGIPQLIMGAVQLLTAIAQAIPQIIPPLVAAIPTITLALVNGLISAIPALLQGAIQLFMALLDAIPVVIQTLAPQIPTIVNAIVTGLVGCMPTLLQGAIQLLNAIVQAIPVIIQALVPQIPLIVNAIVNTLSNNIPVLLDGAIALFMAIVQAIPQIIGALAAELPTIVNTIMDVMTTLPGKLFDIGCDLVRGLWNGIQSLAGWLWDQVSGWVSGIWDGICDFFGIESPSKEMAWAGRMLDEGLAKGIADYSDEPALAALRMSTGVMDATNTNLSGNGLNSTGLSGDSSAILKKLDGIYERLNNLQIVLDTGTLVGETIDKFDAGLATKQALALRGV